MSWRPSRTALTTVAIVVIVVALAAVYRLTENVATTPTAGAPGATTSTRATTSTGPTTSSAPATSAPATPSSAPTSTGPTPTGPTSAGPTSGATTAGPSFPARPVHPIATGTALPQPPPTLEFVLSSFNVLGASHTTSTGKHPGMASGRARAVGAAELIRRHGAEVIGFQELQTSQLAALRRHTNLDFYPGSSLRRQDSENSIGWRRDRWVAVERHTIRIPYFDGGLRAMPVVKLRSRSTGLEAWFANFHNPAETARFHRQQRYRSEATRMEIALANRLITATGLPVFVTGDMNERSTYFCRFTAGAPMVAARGGTNNGRCRPGRPRAVDWIFGSQGVQFTGYTEDRSRLVDVTTDHPVVVARVRITGRVGG